MAVLNLFDIDMDLEEDPATLDLKTLDNVEAVNQSIDLFITNPYRIGKGLTNRVFSYVFSDINIQETTEYSNLIEDEFRRGYPLLGFNNINMKPEPNNHRILIVIDWFIPGSTLSGKYIRYWHQPS